MAAIARPESTKSTPDRNPEPTPHAALDLEPDSKTSYFNRGYMHMDKKQYDKAIRDYTDAIRRRQ